MTDPPNCQLSLCAVMFPHHRLKRNPFDPLFFPFLLYLAARALFLRIRPSGISAFLIINYMQGLPLPPMLVHVLEESDHRRSVSDVGLGREARTASQHATHPAFSIDHRGAGISSSREGREGLVKAKDGPFLGYEGAVVG